jgi:hypothetical protein
MVDTMVDMEVQGMVELAVVVMVILVLEVGSIECHQVRCLVVVIPRVGIMVFHHLLGILDSIIRLLEPPLCQELLLGECTPMARQITEKVC